MTCSLYTVTLSVSSRGRGPRVLGGLCRVTGTPVLIAGDVPVGVSGTTRRVLRRGKGRGWTERVEEGPSPGHESVTARHTGDDEESYVLRREVRPEGPAPVYARDVEARRQTGPP